MKYLALIAATCFATMAFAESPFPVVRVQVGGDAAVGLRVNGALAPPILFAANNQWGRDEVLLDGIRVAAANGIPNYTFNLMLPSYAGPEALRATLDKFGLASPTGGYLVRVWLGATKDWLEAHPTDCMRRADGAPTAYASLASEAWRTETDTQLRALLAVIAASPHAGRFLGIHLTYLNTGEWFPPDTDDFFDYSEVNRAAFARWYTGTFPGMAPVEIPSPLERDATVWGAFRNPAQSHAAMAYDRYWSALTVQRIAQFAATVKEATEGRSLVGVFYGYTFELNHNAPRALAHSGHTTLAQLLHVDAIDFVAAPYAYFERDADSPGHFHLPVDSLALHGKLALMEDDTYTDLAIEPVTHAIAPGWHARAKDREASLALVRRNATLFADHRAGWWMFDLLSDGRWNHADFWGAIRPQVARLSVPHAFSPRVAFLPNEEAVQLMCANTHPELLQSLAGWRHELGRIGEPVGYYLQSDLTRLPMSVETVILPNAYIVTAEEQTALDALLARGGTVVWTYAPGLFTNFPDASAMLDGASVLERVAKCTGFAVSDAGPGTMSLRLEADGAIHETDPTPWRARLVLSEGNGAVLARYADGAGIAVARRPQGNGTVIYTTVPRIPNDLLGVKPR